jgi:hypothetical protein
MSFSRIKTAVIYACYTDQLSYYDDWQDAFQHSSAFDSRMYDIRSGESLKALKRSVKDFELIVLLHSTNADTLKYIIPCKGLLQSRKGKLLIFPGNEVNLPIVSMEEKIHFLRDVEADFIATQLLPEAGKWLYAECAKSEVVSIPHALNPAAFKPEIPQEDRKIDIGVRSHSYLPIIGDNDRNRLFHFFTAGSFTPPLTVDIDTTSRFNRKDWGKYLNACRGTLANEAGSYFLQRNDETIRAIVDYLIVQRRKDGAIIIKENSLLKKCARMVPSKLREPLKEKLKKLLMRKGNDDSTDILNEHRLVESVDFDEIHALFYKDRPRPPVYTKAISSRHFDAIGTKTCQIMYPGRYNDILVQNVHYLSLAQDHSNINDILERFRDITFRKEMTDRAYEFIMENHTYSHRMELIGKMLESPTKS